MSANQKIQALVAQFTEDLTALVHEAAIDQVQAAITGVPVKRGPGRPRGSVNKKTAKAAPKKSSKRIRRASGDVDAVAAEVLAFVKANDGCSVSDIGAAIGAATKELQLPVRKLIAEKAIKTTGQRRGTRYHAGGRKAAPKKAAKKVSRKGRKKATRRRAKK